MGAIVVTGPDKLLPFAWWATRYMLGKQKLTAVHVTPKKPELPKEMVGVVLGGGQDIDPLHYGLISDAKVKYDLERDKLELQVAREALEREVPLMGICRGAQLINIIKGGTLHQDIRPQRVRTPNRYSIFPVKHASIEKDSKLFSALAVERTPINSLHNQAVDKLGEGLRPVARDDDQFIQAIEGEHKQFVLGVQWHPEYMFTHQVQRKLFAHFAKHVRAIHNP